MESMTSFFKDLKMRVGDFLDFKSKREEEGGQMGVQGLPQYSTVLPLL